MPDEWWQRQLARDWVNVGKGHNPATWFQPLDDNPENDTRSKPVTERPASGFGRGHLVTFPLDPKTIPRREWLVFRAIPKGETTLLVGPPKAAKSVVALHLAVAVMCGSAVPLFGTNDTAPWRFRKGRVLMVHNEDTTNEIKRRLAAIIQKFAVQPPPGSLMILSGADPDAPRYTVLQRNALAGPLEPTPERAYIAETIAAFKPDLVIFDSLASLAAGKVSENANLDMDALMRELQTLAKPAAVLTIHHTSKSRADAPGDATAARGAAKLRHPFIEKYT